MGSIAADRNNDILAGYSVSSSSMYPSIDVAGRLKNDGVGLGHLEAELSIVAGTGSQPDTSNRWGDYSAMRIDPDGCTFWYTTEYYMLTQRFDWSTQIANIKFAGCHNPAYDGYIELCKQTDPDYPVSGTFNFTLTAPFFSTGPIGVPVGSCSPPIGVPSGIVTITEAPQIGVAVENVTAYSDGPFGQIDELDSWTPPEQTATVTVMPGGVNLETVATFTNYAAPPGTLKICKIAGSPSLVGMPFTFTATDGITPHRDIVNAGPAPGGNCVIDGTWPVNDPVTVTETIPTGVFVSNITVEPPDRGGPPNLQGGYVKVTIGNGFTEVDFTDNTVVSGSCNPSSSMSVTLVSGNNVVAYVPQGNWGHGTGISVAVANLEGSYIVGAPLILPNITETINSCASDPSPGYLQTVCTANTKNAYVIQGNNSINNPFTVTRLPSLGSGLIQFTGGCCTNCGVAMDGVHHKAAIGVSIGGSSADVCGSSISGKPGFQFLDLGPAPAFESSAIQSQAGQISEDWLIDPTSTPPRLLSPGEGQSYSCNPVPPIIGCHPNYEIADITYPVSGNTTLQFYENRLDILQGWPGGETDSGAADCSAEIALASVELPSTTYSTPFIADLNQAQWTIGNPGTWSEPAEQEQFFTLTGSTLEGSGNAGGPIAVAQGGSHEGVLGQEGSPGVTRNTITAFRLNLPPWTAFNGSNPAFADWVTCNLGDYSPGALFNQGADPHTVTAYVTPGTIGFPAGDAVAVLANDAPANYVALVDLHLMLKVPRWTGTHICKGTPPFGSIGTLTQPTVVQFVKVVP